MSYMKTALLEILELHDRGYTHGDIVLMTGYPERIVSDALEGWANTFPDDTQPDR